MKLSIVMPAYNEEKRIAKTLAVYSAYFNALKKKKILDYEMVIVINATTDNTLSLVKKAAKSNKNISYLDLEKGGKGYAVTEGFKDALKRKNDLIGFVDVDGSTSPSAFYVLVNAISDADAVMASRYIKGAVVSPRPSLARFISSRMYNMVIRALFLIPYRDTQCGAKLFRRKVLEKTIPDIKMSKWAFDMDYVYHVRKNGFILKEIPTVWGDSEYSKINFMKSGPRMVLGVIRLRLLNSPFKWLIRVYDRLASYTL